MSKNVFGTVLSLLVNVIFLYLATKTKALNLVSHIVRYNLPLN